MRRLVIQALLCLVTVAASGASPKFYSDDPLWIERDTQDASGVRPWEITLFLDLTSNLFGKPGDPAADVRAMNVNTVDGVPDSSWFTNRAGRRALTVADITTGPNTTNGPAPGRWAVSSPKSEGVTPGFTITDSTGQRWFIKFDPPGYRGMATGTEVVVTKLLWALGYHVPENYIAALRPEQLTIAEGTRFTPPGDRVRLMRPSDVEMLLARAVRDADGSYRVIASKALDGTPLGGFRFYDTRPDDPNDVVPHEHRRELRGYGTFAAWLNHVDSKASNSLDTLIRQDGRAFVRHHLIDFGSALGSAAVTPREYWEGSESIVEPGITAKQMGAFGFYFPAWHTTDYFDSPAIGRMPRDNAHFDPDAWKPRVPNPAFLRARPDDKIWAAQKLATMTDDLLRAAVQTGEFRDPSAEAFLTKALIERRDAILRAYLTVANAVAVPTVDEGGTLTLRNIAVEAGVAPGPSIYRAQWSTFDNATGATRPIGDTASSQDRLPPPANLPQGDGSFVRVDITPGTALQPEASKPVHAYLQRQSDKWRVVGFERMPAEESVRSKR